MDIDHDSDLDLVLALELLDGQIFETGRPESMKGEPTGAGRKRGK